MLALTNPLSHRRLAVALLMALLAVIPLAAAVLLLPAWVWPTAAGIAALGVAIALAEARRGTLPRLPAIRHIAGE